MGSTYLPPRKYICKFCKKEYKKYGNAKSTYCSRNCQFNDTTKIELVCCYCDEKYKTYPSTTKWNKIRKRKKNFCSKKCKISFYSVENDKFEGGRHLTKRGYIKIRKPEHPNNISGYCYEHRLVLEEFLGRYLTKDEDVHHINENKSDNRLENLKLLTSSEHARLHNINRWAKKDAKRRI